MVHLLVPNSVFQNTGSYTLYKPNFVALFLVFFEILEIPCLGRHYATKRTVSVSIPYGVTGIFHWYSPTGLTMALESTQPLTEMSTRIISWRVKATSAWGWYPYHFYVQIFLKSENFNFLEPSGPVQGLLYLLPCIGLAASSWHWTVSCLLCTFLLL